MAASQVAGHFCDGPIAKNILKGVLLQYVKFHAFIIKWTILSYITTSQPNYRGPCLRLDENIHRTDISVVWQVDVCIDSVDKADAGSRILFQIRANYTF